MKNLDPNFFIVLLVCKLHVETPLLASVPFSFVITFFLCGNGATILEKFALSISRQEKYFKASDK